MVTYRCCCQHSRISTQNIVHVLEYNRFEYILQHVHEPGTDLLVSTPAPGHYLQHNTLLSPHEVRFVHTGLKNGAFKTWFRRDKRRRHVSEGTQRPPSSAVSPPPPSSLLWTSPPAALRFSRSSSHPSFSTRSRIRFCVCVEGWWREDNRQ